MRLAGRSPRELAFRLNQLVANLALWAFPGSHSKKLSPSELALPGPALIRKDLLGSEFQNQIVALARDILRHRLPLLGSTIDTGPEIEWRRDYINSKNSGTDYFRLIRYLDFERVGDHKNIWELNRHQHLVTLAQAHLLTEDAEYVEEIRRQLESWWEQNPFLKGINWASALEVAFRALSWLWIGHLIGPSLGEPLRSRLWDSLHQHGAYLACNLSTYFSPNTHLLGEAVALHAIGVKLNEERWRALGAKIVGEELIRQVQADGSHFEQSTYYHLYALDFFLFHYLLSGRPESYPPVLRKMARFLSAIVGPKRLLTCFGDDDGGRLFHPYGPRERFARATLATCSVIFPEESLPFEAQDLSSQAVWWLGNCPVNPVPARPETHLFADSGLASIGTAGTHILMDAGPLGAGGAGHSHADTLSVTARAGLRELLIDPGTFTYVANPLLRDAFRGAGFHNTIRIGGLDQAEPKGPFRWEAKPAVHVNLWQVEGEQSFLDASCAYRGFTHRRRLLALAGELFFVLDEVTGPAGAHRIDQYWHLGDPDVPILLSDPKSARFEEGLRSRVFGQQEASPVLRASWETSLPHLCAVAVAFQPLDSKAVLDMNGLTLSIPGLISVAFGPGGMPVVSRA